MAFVSPDILREVIGSVASGPAGFGVHYEVAGGADIHQGGNAVEIKLNESSLEQARAQNEGGINKYVAKTLVPSPATGGALVFTASKQSHADDTYAALFAKRGLQSVAERGMPVFQPGRRGDHRAVMAHMMIAKNPLLRIRQRHLLRLRKTFDEIASVKKKTVTVNADQFSQRELKKMVDVALQTGVKYTALGPIARAKKMAGYNGYEWSRWGHALIDGSFTAAPRPSG